MLLNASAGHAIAIKATPAADTLEHTGSKRMPTLPKALAGRKRIPRH
jgi:hypothetical protein